MTNLSVILIGFTAMASQILFMRELITAFSGNELSISLILASWLIGGAIGSFVLGRVADRASFKIEIFAACQALVAVLLPLTIFAIRMTRPALGMSPWEIMPFWVMALASFLMLVPVSVILGFLFALASKTYAAANNSASGKIGGVYTLEAAGSMAGGIAASLILIKLFTPLRGVWILSILNIISALFILKPGKSLRLFSIVVGVAAISLWGGIVLDALDGYSLKKIWQGFELEASKNSVYGTISVVKRYGQYSFFDNGIRLYTVPDELASEEGVHYALLENRDPKDVLLIGGGPAGLAKEILKYPVERLDYVELDPLIIEMSKEYLPPEYYRPLEDRRVSIINEDGRYFVKNTARRYDCVIIALGDPYTAQLNRFYTAGFFSEVKKILKKGGIISFGVTSSESYISKELGEFLKSIYATVKTAFGDVKVMPGETAYFIASADENLTYDYNVLMARARERRVETKYVREYYLFSKLSPEKIAYTEGVVKGAGKAMVNHDFKPISYYYGIVFWSTKFRDSLFSKAIASIGPKNIWRAAAFLFFMIIVAGFILRRRPDGRKKAALFAVASGGFTAMTAQVAILLSFQIIYGYLFYKLGIILTAFMAGLAAGSFWMTRAMPKFKSDIQAFMRIQGAYAVYPLILPVLFWYLAGAKEGAILWTGSNILFPLISMVSGFIGGAQFPLANRIYLDKDDAVGRAAGLTYGIDLAGSCAGAVLTGVFLIPVLGIPAACLITGALNFAVLIFLIIS